MLQIKPGLLVFLGASLGTLARALINHLTASTLGGISTATVIVNVVGAFLMGMLVTTWGMRRGLHPLWDRIKIFAGTGFLGAFTTYSAFALAVAQNIDQPTAFIVAAGTILAGVTGVWLGTTLAKKFVGEEGEK